jgi:SET domain-containing protein
MGNVLPLLTGLLELIKPNPEANERKNLRLAWRFYKRIKKEFKKGGLDEFEKAKLKELKEALVEKALQLGM